MTYRVKMKTFEGPLDILLNLIDEKKLLINEISLTDVCNEFVTYIKKQMELPKAEAASFLVIASTLMLIKSRTLIPTFELSEEEQESIEELETRLEHLREFRRIARRLQEYARARKALYSREAFCGYEFGYSSPKALDVPFLQRMLGRVINSLPSKELLPEKVLESVISIEEKTRDLINRISSHVSGSLTKIISGKDKAELIVGFLAILELMKQGFLEVEQRDVFGDVELKKVS